jgi:hypothetical protein
MSFEILGFHTFELSESNLEKYRSEEAASNKHKKGPLKAVSHIRRIRTETEPNKLE